MESETLIERLSSIPGAINARQLAEMLHCSEKMLYKQARAGRVPSFRIGSLVRFDPVLVADWLKARSIPGISAGRLVGHYAETPTSRKRQ